METIYDSKDILDILPHRHPFVLVDRIVECNDRDWIVGLKNVSASEPWFEGHFPGQPVFPGVLQLEAMAQTAGILVGEARGFAEKVVLAKIKKAAFHHYVRPGDTITLHAEMESIAPEAASTIGEIRRGDELIAQISLMFSHVDKNLAGKKFPEENFVFTDMFNSLLTGFVETHPDAELSR